MPVKIAKHIADTTDRNPDFTVEVWSPAKVRTLLEAQYPSFLPLYDGLPHAIQRSDFSRYAILHAHGGLYMDLDYVTNVPLSDILSYIDSDKHLQTCSAFVNETPNAVFIRRLSNSMMLARAPGHPFWLHVMRMAHNGNGTSTQKQVLTGTGPRLIDDAYKQFNKRYAGPPLNTVGVLPKEYFNPCGICERGSKCGTRKHVLAYHENAGSWNDGGTKAVNCMYCNAGWIVAVLVLSILCVTFIVLFATTTRKRKV